MQSQPFSHISDTARFVAFLRTVEGERPDAHFRDPLALKFVGGDQEKMKRFMRGNSRFDARTMAVRTKVIDDKIMEMVRGRRVDLVLNLAAGLDTRPYRMDLPKSLRWVEVDLPGILEEKEQILKAEKPRCKLERVKLDLSDRQGREALFTRLNAEAKRVLVITEGLLMYLPGELVSALADDLAAQPHFSFWMMDLLSPETLRWIQRKFGATFRAANAAVHFGPEEGTFYFRRFGWAPLKFYSIAEESRRLRREPATMLVKRWLAPLLPAALRAKHHRAYGIAALENVRASR